VLLAGAGFAIGSQSGDGSAEAARGGDRVADSRHAHFRGPGFGSLADDLGVSEEQLREALESIRPDEGDRDDKHAELAAALAKSLGVEESKVTEALEGLHEARHNEFADALTEELGIEASKARSVLESLRPDRSADRSGPPRPPSIATLARRLGVSRAELRAALREAGPPGPGRHHRRGGPGRHGLGERGAAIAEELAQALGVEAARVEEAFEAFHEAKRDEFAQKLGDALGIDVDKVRDALSDKP
jgi:Mn-dependent DtxR family transcriptional regulator